MSTEYWKTLEQRIKGFWKPGQSIICLKVFKKEDSQCELCDYQPVTWNHVLINLETTETLSVGSRCVNNFKKVLDKLESRDRFLVFEKYLTSVDDSNKTHVNTNNIININETVLVIDKFLSENEHLKLKALEPILKFASEIKSDYGNNLFEKAINIYRDNEYHLKESSGLTEEEYNDPQKWKEYLSKEALDEDDQYLNDYNPDYEGNISSDDGDPEGLGLDDVDWDSNNIEER